MPAWGRWRELAELLLRAGRKGRELDPPKVVPPHLVKTREDWFRNMEMLTVGRVRSAEEKRRALEALPLQWCQAIGDAPGPMEIAEPYEVEMRRRLEGAGIQLPPAPWLPAPWATLRPRM